MTTLGLIFPPDRPPEQLKAAAVSADAAGLEQLWLWEDCFKESGIATAAAILGWTERLTVGIGLLPVPLRNVALTAMELATVERLFPGRFLPGIGHGVLDWMGQVGARAASPMTLLGEYTSALRRLLAGDTVTVDGRYVRLTGVALDWPPAAPPPVLVGAVGDRTVQLAGELADGVIVTDEAPPQRVREVARATVAARERADREGDPPAHLVAFVAVDHRLDAAGVAEVVRGRAEAGATHTILLVVGEDAEAVDLGDYAGFVAQEVRPLVP